MNMSAEENEETFIRHKKEKKDLQSKIMKLKKSVPKGDKRRLKEVKMEITELENTLLEKHKNEILLLNEKVKKNETNSEIEEISDEFVHVSLTTTVANDDNLNKTKISKAKRKRDRKAAKQKERNQQVELDSQKDYYNSQRYKEEELMKNILLKQGLEVKHMKSDGNCLYYAIEDQLKNRSLDVSHNVNDLRRLTAEYMLKHSDEFLPFLTNHDTGGCYSHDEFIQYCDDIQNTSAWGGQLELRALSQVLRIPIHVLQAESPPVIIGEEFQEKEIILTYHRHQFGLGEHYNSVSEIIEDNKSI